MTEQEFRLSLGAYVLGALEPDENLAVERHLHDCAPCRLEYLEFADTVGALGTVPPDVAAAGLAGELPGPPPSLLPTRAYPVDAGNGPASVVQLPAGAGAGAGVGAARRRAPRSGRTPRRATWLVATATAAAAAMIAAVTVGVAVRTSRPGGGDPTAPAVRPPVAQAHPGRTLTGTSPSTGVAMVVTLRSEPGGTRLDATVTGRLQPGWQCQLVIRPHAGAPLFSGSKLVTNAVDGIRLDGSVMLPMEQIGRVEIQRPDGQVLVSLPL